MAPVIYYTASALGEKTASGENERQCSGDWGMSKLLRKIS